MRKFRWLVLSECGWTQFTCGFCCAEAVAQAQLSIFCTLHPERVFTIQQSD